MKTMKDDNNTKEEEEKKKKKKGFITEEDTATLLQRYSATTILTLLQEVSHCVNSEKIDYDALVANTVTGITNAREYQMLWRHLAYREPLPDKFIDGDRPMDVDSDYEYDVEVDPAVTADASTEAAACVKIPGAHIVGGCIGQVLIASHLPSDPSHLNGTTVEAPLTINIPSAPAKGMNITVPVSIQRQTLPATTTAAAGKAEGDDANTPASNIMPLRKKRKKWSAEEDLELINAVNVYGEGNWTQIVKANFKGDRTANQLSQRWGIVKKRQRKMGPAEESAPSVKKEALLAAHQAMTHFLDDGPNRTPITVGTGRTNVNSNPAETNANIGVQITTAEGLNAKTSRMGSFGPTPKGRITSKKTLPKSNVDADRLIATAVAAGARIVSQSDAELLKAATQANNSIHVIPQTGGSMKSPAVRHIRTGLAATVPSTHPPTRPPGSLKTAVSRSSQQALKTDTSRTITGVTSCPDADVLPEQVQTGEHLSGRGQIQEGKVELPKQNAASEILLTNGQNPAGSLDAKKHGSNDKTLTGNDQSAGNGEDQITTQEQRTDVSDKDLKQGGGSH